MLPPSLSPALSPASPRLTHPFSGKLADVPLASLVPSLETNLLAAIYLLQPALPHLRASAAPGAPSRVIFVSSGASTGAYQAWGMYSLAKAGLNSLARTFAVEEKDAGVAFLSVRPGVVDVSSCCVTCELSATADNRRLKYVWPLASSTGTQTGTLLTQCLQMQREIRTVGPAVMKPNDMAKFNQLHEGGQLLPPDACGSVIAGCAVGIDLAISGEYVDWADERFAQWRKQ
jgi:NAD(P)-dependent dehydrogenase (short-subunit alcohol dehydrogenase family)